MTLGKRNEVANPEPVSRAIEELPEAAKEVTERESVGKVVDELLGMAESEFLLYQQEDDDQSTYGATIIWITEVEEEQNSNIARIDYTRERTQIEGPAWAVVAIALIIAIGIIALLAVQYVIR